MTPFDVLSSGFPLLVETLLEDVGPGGPIHVLFGVSIGLALLGGLLLISYSRTFVRSTASRIHNESALALWYGIVAWVAVIVATIVLGAVGPPIAYLGGVLWLVVEMIGYAAAAIALGLFVLRGPLEAESADDQELIGDDQETIEDELAAPSDGGFDGVAGDEASPWLALVVGTIPIGLLVIIPIVGGVLSILISAAGIGALALEYLEYEEPTPSPTEG